MKRLIYLVVVMVFISILSAIVYIYTSNILMKRIDKKYNNQQTTLMNYDKYKNINVSNIKKIIISRYTVAGVDDKEFTDKEEINSIYKGLNKYKVGKETDMACEDNTTIYKFIMNDDTNISLEIECDWVIIDKKRYVLE